MNEYWTTVTLMLAWINFFGAFFAAVWLAIGAFEENSWRMWASSVLCVLIWVLNTAYLTVAL